MTNSKRDESRDLFVGGGMYPCVGGRIINGTREPEERTHYVPYSELEAAQRRIAELEKAARDFKKHADALMLNVYNEYHANESLSVHEVGQLLRKCCDTGSALDALIKPKE